MDLKEYRNRIFPILECSHFYLVCFVLKNMAITVIDNMHPSVYSDESGNYEDCGVYAMRHMETWMGIIDGHWDAGFLTEMAIAKKKITHLRRSLM
ncbi:putative papain-like cysteine peptidase superfamily [Helianthus anomalus]